MRQALSILLMVALGGGSAPLPNFAPRVGSGAANGCCGAMSCCEAGPPCAGGARACAASAHSNGSSGCSLGALPCGSPSARVTVAAVDPMLRPGVATAIEAPITAETVACIDRRGGRRATEPAVPPPRT